MTPQTTSKVMNYSVLLLVVSCAILTTSAWSVPYHPARAPMRFTRFALHPQHHHRIPSVHPDEVQRPKRDDYEHNHDHDYEHGHDDGHHTNGVMGPVHTFVKTDKNANYKWGVRHHVGNKYAP